METKAQTTVKAVKELGGEVSAWEHRVSFLQSEAEGLKKRNDQIKKEIESALSIAQQELDRKRDLAKKEKEKTDAELIALEAQKAEFQGILTVFKKERTEFEREKDRTLDLQKDAQRLKEKASNFILFVRREAEKL